MKLLLDEMYPAALADALRAAGIDATTVGEQRIAGLSDVELFAKAAAGGHVLLTENVGDFTRIAVEHSIAGAHHPGVLIALSSRFSRRRAGIPSLVGAILSIAEQKLTDRIVYLERSADL